MVSKSQSLNRPLYKTGAKCEVVCDIQKSNDNQIITFHNEQKGQIDLQPNHQTINHLSTQHAAFTATQNRNLSSLYIDGKNPFDSI